MRRQVGKSQSANKMWPSGVYKILSECLTLKKIKKSHVKMQIRGLLEEISISGALGASPPPPGEAGCVVHTALGLCSVDAETEFQTDEDGTWGVMGRSWGQSQAWGLLRALRTALLPYLAGSHAASGRWQSRCWLASQSVSSLTSPCALVPPLFGFCISSQEALLFIQRCSLSPFVPSSPPAVVPGPPRAWVSV